MSFNIEHGEIDRLAATLHDAAAKSPREAAKVVEKGALNIKNAARQRIGRPAHAPAYAISITYDSWMSFSGPTAEIGPDKGKRQGALGNLLEYGSVNNAPIPHIAPSAEEELPRFEKALEDLARRLVEEP